MCDIVIKVNNLSKEYELGVINYRTFQEDVQSRFYKLFGKEDPNAPINYNKHLIDKHFKALDNVSFEIHKGERVGLIGLNGAGKSTLLKILSRITLPTDGSADIYGKVSSMLEIGTGFHREMTGRENIYMNGAILGMSKKEIDAKIEEIIDYSEVREFIDTPVKRYSSGMFVKLAFAVSVYLNSDIMIMDEVLAVGDAKFQDKCISKLEEISNNQNKTIISVSHNMNTIRRLCDRVIVLQMGKIVYDGNVEEGIDYYLNNASKGNLTSKDLEHNVQNNNQDLVMKHLTLVNKESNVYGTNEKLKLKIDINTLKELKNVKFRLTFRNKDDVAVSTSYSNSLDLSKGESSVIITYDLNSFYGGNFYCSIGFYLEDEIGNYLLLDHITRAFTIEINNNRSMVNAYGYMKLKECEMEEIK